MTEPVKRECKKKDVELAKKLTRVVFNKWYSETMMENAIVVPEEPSDSPNKSPVRNKQRGSPVRNKQNGKNQTMQTESDSNEQMKTRADSPEYTGTL